LFLTGFPSAAERAEIVLALARAMLLGDGAAEALHSGAAADTAALLTGADLQVCAQQCLSPQHMLHCTTCIVSHKAAAAVLTGMIAAAVVAQQQ
jgi:hypothetical protein